ncbi:maleylpyruvate isomerase family mycothiol-dependent enzyme [Nonomuraea aurantiaca]|uniref:maleylpyruvate isomerase family mycothiol-dependent enzyme n=1 Tax=Nonomuraea aurantiaca TaxID=2878562 RepID=UPI001CD98EE0|nr:maleylpyruvate isomerase family mycothiol-dependent enzyme [Nonomuraea aurantiaca]MCA2221103.1 maleylpyruvate isomerase family mycothiol-dependent enzyme [Nonomuraea aurantiaca]
MRKPPPTTHADTAGDAWLGGVALLGRAVDYALGCLCLVASADLDRPTPCHGWDLRTLLAHTNDSFAALTEAASLGHVALDPLPSYDSGDRHGHGGDGGDDRHEGDRQDDGHGRGRGDGDDGLRYRATRLLHAWAGTRDAVVSVGGCPLTAAMVSAVGAVEVAVHAWDVARACGHPRPIPDDMAAELLPLARLFVTDADRPARFAVPLNTAPRAPAQDRLLAYLGRDPHWTDNRK